MERPIVKWVNRLDCRRHQDGATMYHTGQASGFGVVSDRVSDAITYDVKFFANKYERYTLVPITKKELFTARLKDA